MKSPVGKGSSDEILMSHDPGLLLDLGVGLPSPPSRRASFLFAHAVSRFCLKSEEFLEAIEKVFRQLILDFDDLVGLLRFQIQFANGNLGSELAAADAARKFVFRRAHRMTATLANIAILPGAVSIPFFFHNARLCCS